MDWSEILTDSEAEYMRDRVLPHLAALPWGRPLVDRIEREGGLTYENKPLLFEARIAYALDHAGPDAIAYEYGTGVGGSTVDFWVGSTATWLIEVVSIQRSAAAVAATKQVGPFTLSKLSSPAPEQTPDEQKQSEEGESLLVVQKIGEKVHDGSNPIKFPTPQPGTFHMIVVDMRGHFGGGDIHDWKQIAFCAEAVAEEYRKYWLHNGARIPVQGVWSVQNPMRFAGTARERLHAIMFVAEEAYADGTLTVGSWIACNPHLFQDEVAACQALQTCPLTI